MDLHVAEPPGGQRAETEQRKRADAERHQVGPVVETELRGDGADRGRENQQEHVVDRVTGVQQHGHEAREPVGTGGSVGEGSHGA